MLLYCKFTKTVYVLDLCILVATGLFLKPSCTYLYKLHNFPFLLTQ